MKTARLQLAVFACLALIPRAGYADKRAPRSNEIRAPPRRRSMRRGPITKLQ